MLKKTYDKFVRPEGVYDGKKVSKSDVIELQRGGTGFVAHDKDTKAKKYWHLGPGSGLTDLRGQHKGPTSHSGLMFMN